MIFTKKSYIIKNDIFRNVVLDMLDRNSCTPLYIQLANYIRQQIIDGKIAVGDKLPSESEMIEEYSVGRRTIRDAIAILANEGLIEKHHGKGSFCKACILPPKYRIDVLLDLTDHYFVPHYLHAICSALEDEDVSLVLNDTKDDANVICSVLEKIMTEGTDGILFQPSPESMPAPEKLASLLEQLAAQNIPYIMIDRAYENVPPSFVIMNEEQSGAIAANYFQSLGHKNLAMVTLAGRADSELRWKGFCDALQTPPLKINFDDNLDEALDKLLKESPKITGLFCYNDIVAQKCYRCLKHLSVSVPDDISIVSVDDTVIASTLSPSLTSVAHPKEYLGKAAAKTLLSMITGTESWPLQKVFEPSLHIRKSCKAR